MTGLRIEKQSVAGNRKPDNTSSANNFNWQDLFKKDITFRKFKLSNKVKEDFYQGIAVLLEAGIDLRSALELMVVQQKKTAAKDAFQAILQAVVEGSSFSNALKNSNLFSAYEYYSIKIGEETGALSKVLSNLATYYRRVIKQRRQIIQALFYPIVVLTASFGAVAFMVSFIVPMFAEVFARFNSELPFITKMVIALSNNLTGNAWLYLFGFVCITILFTSLSKLTWFRNAVDSFILRIPIIGELMRKIYLSRLCTTFSLVIAAHIPLLQGVKLIKQMINFYPLALTLEQMEADILNGQSLHASMSKFNIYDQRMRSLVKVGEETNRLDLFFEKLMLQYNEEIDYQSSLLSSILEPFIIIFLGGMVAIILLAMYLPMFQLSTSI